jgi:hypothetical protein
MERLTFAEQLPKGLKKHESKLQERRHDRKSELQRLDNLKKTLQSRLQLHPLQERKTQVA